MGPIIVNTIFMPYHITKLFPDEKLAWAVLVSLHEVKLFPNEIYPLYGISTCYCIMIYSLMRGHMHIKGPCPLVNPLVKLGLKLIKLMHPLHAWYNYYLQANIDLQNCPFSVHSVLIFCLVLTTVSSLRQMFFATLIFMLLLVTQSVQSSGLEHWYRQSEDSGVQLTSSTVQYYYSYHNYNHMY